MKFLKKNENTERYIDNIFSVVKMAKADKDGINATAGCLYDEEGKLFTYKCVEKADHELTAAQKAAYASSPAGNDDYRKAVSDFVLEGKVSNHHICVASAGGTGAIYLSVKTCLDEGDTIICPDIAWGNYKVIAAENNLRMLTYDVYDLDDMFRKIASVDSKVFLITNSPCENPLGYAYTYEEWKRIINYLNGLHKETILLCDIAYIDYAHNEPKKYFELFNDISDDLLVVMAVSCSKAFSFYGQRLGAMIAIHNDLSFLDLYENLCSRLCRSTWSNLNNPGMHTVVKVLNEYREEYEKELSDAKDMLKRRTDIFIRQAEECGLEYYKFSDGFFVTLKIKDNKVRDEVHQKLLDSHIYTIKVNKGIRIALCSVPYAVTDGLARKIKEIM